MSKIRSESDKYSTFYRIIKTILLVATWITFGLNTEIISSCFEDYRIQLSIDYQSASFLLVLRGVGYLVVITFIGALVDRFSRFADLFLASGCFSLAICNILIPLTRSYSISMIYHLTQGIGSALYDVSGNHIILELWKGISNSPINAMHAGYGVGAMIAVRIAKPFIKFNPNDNVQSNNNTTLIQKISPDDLEIFTPFTISAASGIFIAVLFIIAQIFQVRIERAFIEKNAHNIESLQQNKYDLESEKATVSSVKCPRLQKLLFDDRSYKPSGLIYMIFQISFLTLVLCFIQGFTIIISKFSLTYFTLGPAKLDIKEYTDIQSLFWLLFVIARFIAAFLAFKMNPLLFVFILFLLNTITSFLFLIPQLTEYKLFFTIGMSILGLSLGPCHPSTFMAAKKVLKEYNSFIIAIFSTGVGLSGIFFQQIPGSLLDLVQSKDEFLGFKNFNSSYLIPHLIFGSNALCLIFFITVLIVYKKFKHLI